MKDNPQDAPRGERQFSVGEEISHSITHGIGALISIAALVLLVVFAARTGNPRIITGYAVFGSTLVILFSISSVFHGLVVGRAKQVMEIMDYSAIYLLIAGSYTAFCFTALKGASTWILFSAAWTIAVIGIVMKAVFPTRFPKAFLSSYLIMGWLIAPFFDQVRAALPTVSFALLVAGGLAYTVGSVAFALQRFRWLHFVWHLFVLAGAVCHALSAMSIVA